MQKIWIQKRMQFLYNLESKKDFARKLMKSLSDKRLLLFCGSINQAEDLYPNTFHSKSSDKGLKKFIDGKESILSCVDALNEGVNIPNVDAAIIVQAKSKQRHMVQRVGRIVRYREGHLGEIYILCAAGTQDETWVTKALSEFDKSAIKHIYAKDFDFS